MAAPLKDQLNPTVVADLARRFAAEYPPFDGDGFETAVGDDLEDLELKDRVNLIADELARCLPADYPQALKIVVAVAGDDTVDPWAGWPLCSFVERHGLDHPEASLQAMSTLTKRWSCEFAIRPYLTHHTALTRRYLRQWVNDDHEAVRRLSSEGTRPLLPWGPRVQVLLDEASIGLEMVSALRHDPSESVRRSVANHLNDVAKLDPELVLSVIGGWLDDDAGAGLLDRTMIAHGLRTLVKNGHPGALETLGYTTDPRLEVEAFTCTPSAGTGPVAMGESILLEAAVRSTTDVLQKLVIDFVIHHVTASGGTSSKVFKWTTRDLAPGELLTVRKRRRIEQASTRTYHAGRHRVELQIGGRIMAESGFDVMIDEVA